MLTLDDTDRRLLTLLQRDASLPTAELAESIGLSQSPCWRRIKRLRDAGVITGDVCLVDPKAVGLGVTVFATVNLDRHSEAEVAKFDAAVEAAPEVMECYAVTGDRDYMLRIVVPDIEAYERFISRCLLNLPAVRSVNSRFALRRVKHSTVLPL